MDISIVIPTYNEVENLDELHSRLEEVLDILGKSYELVFVDDGSDDGTSDKLRHLASSDNRVKVIFLRRNFGQTPALSAGIAKASGDVIITMDADLQNDPNDIPKLLEKMGDGFDIVRNNSDKETTEKICKHVRKSYKTIKEIKQLIKEKDIDLCQFYQ